MRDLQLRRLASEEGKVVKKEGGVGRRRDIGFPFSSSFSPFFSSLARDMDNFRKVVDKTFALDTAEPDIEFDWRPSVDIAQTKDSYVISAGMHIHQ
jgi:HSP20 family molecular chaperone IbpA